MTRAEEYLSNFSRTEPDPQLLDFMGHLPPNAHVLDMGCGPGTASALMAERGHRPDPVDAAMAMVDVARRQFELPARVGSFTDLNGPYDGVWANFSLLHMPRDDLPGFFPLLARHMAPGAPLHLAMKTGSGQARDRLGRQYSYITEAEARDWLSAAGFQPAADAATGQELGMAGDVEPWFALIAHRGPDT